MNVGTVIIVPVSLCMGFPVFLLSIVSEKEKRLIEIMKINGMKMSNYWMVSYFFNYLLYTVVIFVFMFWGRYVFRFNMFTNTNFLLLFIIFNGWGMAQISWAFFVSVFINKAQVASIAGYGIAVYFMAIA